MTSGTISPSIEVWHNIMWSKYKAHVFSSLYKQGIARGVNMSFIQIAETERDRKGLSTTDSSIHRYPFDLLFKGAYSDVPVWRRMLACASGAWRSKADVIVIAGYHLPEYWAQLLVAKLRGKKVAVFCDSTRFDRPQTALKSFAKRFFFRSCEVIFCYGQRSAEYLTWLGVDEKRIVKRCQAAYLPLSYTRESIGVERLKRVPKTQAPVFLYVGRLSTEKNLPRLIAAFRTVLKALPDARLEIVGDGPQRSELERDSGDLIAGAKLRFLGGRDIEFIFSKYLDSTCLVLPSLSEPWGLVVNEALAHGCPVVVSDRCGCVPELVKEAVTGFAFDPYDTNALSQKMIAAVAAFGDTERVTTDCLRIIGEFTADNAALSILEGCIESTRA